MNSLEALDELSLMINREKHINSELNKKINDLKQTIKQDLDRLEVLEKSSKDFQDRTFNIINTYKKAIEILKDNSVIEFNDDLQFIHLKEDISQTCDYTIIDIKDKQEYYLLKEVLGE